MAETGTSVSVVEDSSLMEQLAREGVEVGESVSASDWLLAVADWVTDGVGFSMPEMVGSSGLSQVVLLLVAGCLGVAAIRWLVRQAKPPPRHPTTATSVAELPHASTVHTSLAEALSRSDIEGALAACWLLVELRLDANGVVLHRPDRSAYELVMAVQRASPAWAGIAALHEVATTYVRLRYGPTRASLEDAQNLAALTRRFVDRFGVEQAA